MAILPLLQKLSFHVPGLSEKKRKNMERRLAFHEWTKGFRRFFRRPFVFLFGSPFHSNLGDQAQTECIIAWIRKNLPRHEIFIATYMNTSPRLLKMIRRHIRKNDILLCHSGYHMTDLYNEQSHYLRIAQLFPDHPLTILPQTIHYQDDSHAQATADILNSHPDCTLLCRDEHSYETARALFNKCRLFLYPDIVTSLIGNIKLPEATLKERQAFLEEYRRIGFDRAVPKYMYPEPVPDDLKVLYFWGRGSRALKRSRKLLRLVRKIQRFFRGSKKQA